MKELLKAVAIVVATLACACAVGLLVLYFVTQLRWI